MCFVVIIQDAQTHERIYQMRKGLKKSAVVILLVFLLLCSAVPAFAQDAPKPFCGKLAADDCELLASAQEAAKEIGSGTYNSEINFKLAGVPGLPVKEISFNLTQDASYALDPELSAQLADMQTMTPEEMAKNMDKMVDLLLEVYGSLSYDGVMNLTLPKDIADLLSAQAGTTVPEEIQLQIRIVDGYGYLNLEDLAAFNPPNADQLKGWAGLDLLSIMKTGLQQSLQQGAVDTSQLGPMAGLSIGNLLGSEENRALLDPYVGVERQRDDTIDDQDVAVIQTTFNMGGFVGSPLFRDLVISQLPTINQLAETDLTEQQVTESLTML